MTSRLRAWLEDLGDQFWLRPALVVLFCIGLAHGAVLLDRGEAANHDFASIGWIYSGGEEGARSLLGSVASSAIGVASTIFSITIAALSLASGQMGPRLLRNFVRDGRNQVSLGIFLGTFAYALVVLRTVRTASEQEFVPSLATTGALILALLCVGTLVWYDSAHRQERSPTVQSSLRSRLSSAQRSIRRQISRSKPRSVGS